MRNCYNISILIFLGLISIPFLSQAQAPVIQWDKTLGGTGADQCADIIQTTDGGYVAAGRSTSGANGDKTEPGRGLIDYWIVKLDPTGSAIQWQKTLGTSADDMPAGIYQTRDGGFMVSGQSNGGFNGDRTIGSYGARDYWVLKLNTTGIPVWQTAFGGSSNDMGYCMATTSDEGFIIGGASTSGASGTRTEPNRGDYDYWIIKLDSARNQQWNKAIGGPGWEQQNMVWQTHDGGYALGGATRSGVGWDKTEASRGGIDYWVVKIDSARNIQWQKTFGGTGDDYLTGMQQTSDRGYILCGHSNSGVSGDKLEPSRGGYDYWIIRLDSSGNQLWQKTIGGSGDETIGGGHAMHCIKQTPDGGFVIAGTSDSPISGDKTEPSYGGFDYWFFKISATGNLVWQKTIGGSANEQARSLQLTSDGGYVIGGVSNSPISGDKTEANRGGDDFWIVKLNHPCDTTTTILTDSFCIGTTYQLPGGKNIQSPGTYRDTIKSVAGCDSMLVFQLNWINDSISLLAHNILGPDTFFCDESFFKLDASYPQATNYNWSNMATTAFINVNSPGTYHVEISTINGCVGRDTITLSTLPAPKVDLGSDISICDRDTPVILKSAYKQPYHNLWGNGLSDSLVRATRSGHYWLEVSLNECRDSDTIYIDLVPTPNVFIGLDTTICEQFPHTIGTTVSNASYQWNTGASSAFIDVNKTGRYILAVSIRGCTASDTIDIIAMPEPEIDLGGQVFLCSGKTMLLDAGYGSGFRYLWNTQDTVSAISIDALGTFYVTVISEHGCVGSDTVVVGHHPKPHVNLGPDTVVCPSSPLLLRPWYINADSLTWSDGVRGTNRTIKTEGIYIIEAHNKCGTVNDTIEVSRIFCDIWLPNAFTPNKDGKNDVFRATGNLTEIEGFNLTIFNRWGEMVFHTADKLQGWDGTVKGIEAAAGVYFYMLEYNVQGKPYFIKGDLQLIR